MPWNILTGGNWNWGMGPCGKCFNFNKCHAPRDAIKKCNEWDYANTNGELAQLTNERDTALARVKELEEAIAETCDMCRGELQCSPLGSMACPLHKLGLREGSNNGRQL